MLLGYFLFSAYRARIASQIPTENRLAAPTE